MTRNNYDLTIFIGRFSPFHKGHEKVVYEAFQNSDFVMVMPGSDKRPTDSRNPYTTEVREQMIRAAFPEYDYRLIVEPLEDIRYNDPLWCSQVQAKVDDQLKGRIKKALTPKIALIGYEKDGSSYYVNMFPQWDNIMVSPYRNDLAGIDSILNASDIREAIYENEGFVPDYITDSDMNPAVVHYLDINERHEAAMEEYFHTINYKKQFAGMPYPPIHHTTDAVVIQSGHVLIGKRRAMPGRGLMCLPGGFLNETEFMVDGMIRELKEETKIKVPPEVLRSNITRVETFDDPNRSVRGRTITTAYLISLPNGPLPKVKGSDDMYDAKWVPLSEIRSEDMFEDHFDILEVMTGNRLRKW